MKYKKSVLSKNVKSVIAGDKTLFVEFVSDEESLKIMVRGNNMIANVTHTKGWRSWFKRTKYHSYIAESQDEVRTKALILALLKKADEDNVEVTFS